MPANHQFAKFREQIVRADASFRRSGQIIAGFVDRRLATVDEQLRAGHEQRVGFPMTRCAAAHQILYPQHRQLAPRVRAFVDWASQVYAAKFGGRNGPNERVG